MLLKLADLIDSIAEEIAKLESLNTGKPFHLALNDELPAISDVFRFYAGACRNMPGAAAGEYMAGFTSMIRRDPVGIIASIAPYEFATINSVISNWPLQVNSSFSIGSRITKFVEFPFLVRSSHFFIFTFIA